MNNRMVFVAVALYWLASGVALGYLLFSYFMAVVFFDVLASVAANTNFAFSTQATELTLAALVSTTLIAVCTVKCIVALKNAIKPRSARA
ncbi:MAG: hypothetical protein ABIQ64_01650 [Candidatus Saccharimonadales bacterium]